MNQDDFIKFKRIEKLIGKEIEKAVVPTALGETPQFQQNRSNPKTKPSGNKKIIKLNRSETPPPHQKHQP